MSDEPCGCAPIEVEDEALFEDALHLCARCHGVSRQDILEGLRQGDPRLHSSLRYGLAKGVSKYLGSLGSSFREVYVRGSAAGQRANPASDIDVIVVVRKRRDEVLRLLGLLDILVTARYRDLIGFTGRLCSLLDIQVVEDETSVGNAGRSAVLGGLNTRPICLWRSSPEEATGASFRGSPRQSSPEIASTTRY